MDDPQPQSFPTSILNNQKVSGRDRDIPRNNLGDKAIKNHNGHCVLRAYFVPNKRFIDMPSLLRTAYRPMRGGLLSPHSIDGKREAQRSYTTSSWSHS